MPLRANTDSSSKPNSTTMTTNTGSHEKMMCEKREKRRASNRQSARKSRYREAVMVETLNDHSRELNKRNTALRHENESLRSLITSLKRQIQQQQDQMASQETVSSAVKHRECVACPRVIEFPVLTWCESLPICSSPFSARTQPQRLVHNMCHFRQPKPWCLCYHRQIPCYSLQRWQEPWLSINRIRTHYCFTQGPSSPCRTG